MIGAYRSVPDFARPGWRLTLPGGPAGGHYKGFTHTQAAGTTILPTDDYELDRGDGMSSHDMVHASNRNPRGVYRSSGEVPPRPNASGSAHTYRGIQTRHHAGQSVAPGSFPSDYFETGEDDFLSLAKNAPHFLNPLDAASQLLGAAIYDGAGSPAMRSDLIRAGRFIYDANSPGPPVMPGPAQVWTPPLPRPNLVCSAAQQAAAPAGMQYVETGLDANNCPVYSLVPIPGTGATSVVNQPPATPAPAPPSPSIPVYTAPPVSPTPAPVVNTNQVVPLNDGSGNYLNLSTGLIVPAASVQQNPATMQLTASPTSSALSWLEQPSSMFPSIPNWGLVAAAAVAASMLMGGKRR
jgi:hypothetical protein